MVDLDFWVARRDGAVAAVALPHEPSGASSQRLSANMMNPTTMSVSAHMVQGDCWAQAVQTVKVEAESAPTHQMHSHAEVAQSRF